VIDVDILGHIFEQSITDLERLRLSLEAGTVGARTFLSASGDLPRSADKNVRAPQEKGLPTTRRKLEGAVYTAAFITRYIVGQALGGVLKVRFETLRQQHEAEAAGTARKPLADPNAYGLTALNEPQRKALIRFWEAWQEVLKRLRILDLACGSGAFLIEAFDQLHARYETSNARLEELRGERTLFDLDRQILQHNLYGVDLNAKARSLEKLPQLARSPNVIRPFGFLTASEHRRTICPCKTRPQWKGLMLCATPKQKGRNNARIGQCRGTGFAVCTALAAFTTSRGGKTHGRA
jgi:hypothetical protein